MYLDGSLESFLNIKSFAHYGLIQLPLERQQVHICLRLGNKLSDLKESHRQNQDHLNSVLNHFSFHHNLHNFSFPVFELHFFLNNALG